jgi:hypothetical protein
MEPLLPWRQDPIAQVAIRSCEDIIAERTQKEGGVHLGSVLEQNGNKPRTWSPVVQQWESLKSIRARSAGPRERIPEADLREIISERCGVQPEDVSEAQIEQAALDLCGHYTSFLMIPSDSTKVRLTVDRLPNEAATQDPAFWKEREDEFRKHYTAFAASWSSWNDTWNFQAGGKTPSSSYESL